MSDLIYIPGIGPIKSLSSSCRSPQLPDRPSSDSIHQHQIERVDGVRSGVWTEAGFEGMSESYLFHYCMNGHKVASSGNKEVPALAEYKACECNCISQYNNQTGKIDKTAQRRSRHVCLVNSEKHVVGKLLRSSYFQLIIAIREYLVSNS